MGRISVSARLCIQLAWMLLILPIQWIAALITAALIHELFHLMALRICGAEFDRISITAGSALMEVSELRPGQEIFCALAGPIGGLFLILMGSWFPRLAFCAFVHTVFNLLPIYPMDGGRIMRCILKMFFSPLLSEAISRGVEVVCGICLIMAGLYMTFAMKMGIMPLLLCTWIVIRIFFQKNPLQRTL